MNADPSPTLTAPRYTAVAGHALLVEFAETLSEPAHAAVLSLDRALAQNPMAGLREAVPAFVSLMVMFDPLRTDHRAVETHLRHCLAHAMGASATGQNRRVSVCYEEAFAPDLAEVCRQTGLGPEAVITAHLAGSYRVCMYGFAPGYAYLAGVPEVLRLPRKSAPVRNVPAGSVLIAGGQCLVSTLTMPTGWWIIGRSPTPILSRDPAHPFLFDVGDSVTFHRIGRAELEAAHG